MKEKLFIFVIGLLVGAIFASGSFLIYIKVSNNSSNQMPQMNQQGGQPPEMSNGQNIEKGQPPSKPSENNSQNNNN